MFHTIVSIKNDGHYFCRAGGNRPDGLNEPVTFSIAHDCLLLLIRSDRIHRKATTNNKDELWCYEYIIFKDICFLTGSSFTSSG
ncbi:hypothetical protein C1192_16045 [Escherichia marmotae]|nr:hypothetical protein C1192_16045 [Escherichia marmotae]